MCSPFFCNHVISTPFDGVSSRRNLRKGSIRNIIDSKLCDQEGSHPWCSSRKHRRAKNSSHGLQHIQEMQKEEKRLYIGSLSEQSKVQSITSGTWVDRRVVCKTRRTCAGGPFIHVNSQRTPTPASTRTVHLNISCKTDQCQSDLMLKKLCELLSFVLRDR